MKKPRAFLFAANENEKKRIYDKKESICIESIDMVEAAQKTKNGAKANEEELKKRLALETTEEEDKFEGVFSQGKTINKPLSPMKSTRAASQL